MQMKDQVLKEKEKMTIEEIKEKFRNSDKWVLFQETDEYEMYGFGYITDLLVCLRNDGFLSISDRAHACYFVSLRIPAELFQIEEHDDVTKIYIQNASDTYGAEFKYLSLYL